MTLVNITLTEEEQAMLLSCVKANEAIRGVRWARWQSIGDKIRRAREDVWEIPPVKIDTDGAVIDSGHARWAAIRPYPVKYSRGEE